MPKLDLNCILNTAFAVLVVELVGKFTGWF